LEEVQKVNSISDAQRDVEEFCETDSAREVLSRISEVIEQDRRLPDPRFLYLHATFGSGKTHLLKLIGYATGQAGVSASVVDELSTRHEGFRRLRNAIEGAPTDRFVPVFLNLLNRDASKEPPIPILMYEAIGTRLGYPTDPRWLTEFFLRLEQEAPEETVWERLKETKVDGQPLLSDRGRIKTRLYEAVPPVMEELGVSCDRDDVKAWVQQAVSNVTEDNFGPEALQERITDVHSLLTTRSGESTELLIGLDEIALFIGDERSRYEELRATMELLIDDPNPVVLGTGQWGLNEVHDIFVGDPDPEAWYSQEVGLEGADTEEIVQRRWLQKVPEMRPKIEDVVADIPPLPDILSYGYSETEERMAAYPLRPGDLRWIRKAMQRLLTRGRRMATEHIQGRALLVLVRSLFIRQGWAEKSLGALVPWTDLFEVLQSETNLIPTWAEELLDRLQSLRDEVDSPVEAVARTVFLLNQAEVLATPDAVSYLLLTHVEEDLDERRAAVKEALDVLDRKNYVFEETEGDQTYYRLLTEREVTVADKVEERADQISYQRLRSKIKEWLQQYGDLLGADDNRREVDIAAERNVPLVVRYSVLQAVPPPSDYANAVALRVLATSEEMDDKIQEWTTRNESDDALENALVAVELPPNFEQRLRRHVARGDVLQNETRHFEELESEHAREERELQNQARNALDQARIIDGQEARERGTYADGLRSFIAEEVVRRKFPNRHSLSRPLQHIDDGPALAAFFRGEGDWPLSDEDATTLGVDRASRSLQEEGSWPAEFATAAKERARGGVLGGDQVIGMIEERGGAFLGTSVEAMSALLLVLATGETLQLRRNGELLRDPAEMGRAVSTKTDIRRLTLRLEPPPDKEAVDGLRKTHRVLTEVGTTPDDTADIIDELSEWARGNAGEMRRVQQFVDRTFDQGSVDTLVSTLKDVGADPKSTEPDVFADDEMLDQVDAYRWARELLLGDATDLWAEFEERLDAYRDEAPASDATQILEDVTEEGVPTPDTVRSALEEAKEEFDRSMESGGDDDYEANGDEAPGPDFQDFFDRFDPANQEEAEERLDKLFERLNEEADGQIVAVRRTTDSS
jgi:hypothetical protein